MGLESDNGSDNDDNTLDGVSDSMSDGVDLLKLIKWQAAKKRMRYSAVRKLIHYDTSIRVLPFQEQGKQLRCKHSMRLHRDQAEEQGSWK